MGICILSIFLLQVLILQQQLEEKDMELKRLREEKEQKMPMEPKNIDSASVEKVVDDAMIAVEAQN